MRLAAPPPEISEEFDCLINEWNDNDTIVSFAEYLKQHASNRVLTYMEELERVTNEDCNTATCVDIREYFENNDMDVEYQENDNLDRETIAMYERMPDEERRALIEKITAEEMAKMNKK